MLPRHVEPNLKQFELRHSKYQQCVLSMLESSVNHRRTVITYYCTIAEFGDDLGRQDVLANKDPAELYNVLKSLLKPSDHLTHLLTALARTGSCGGLIQDITSVTGISPRNDIYAVANNDGLDYGAPVAQTAPAPAPEALSPPNLDGLYYNNVRLLQRCALLDENKPLFFFFFFFFFFFLIAVRIHQRCRSSERSIILTTLLRYISTNAENYIEWYGPFLNETSPTEAARKKP
jgi:hypothetical protein